MKMQSNSLYLPISKEQLENLTIIVSETIATGFTNPNDKIFTAVDLWDIRRRAKGRTQRRFYF